ncbi:MAG: Plug domain-containing protein, partial [Sphingomonadaceae bacterium]|nr:Plug domain-containing protein [Sphingomonadaceae bacterium]
MRAGLIALALAAPAAAQDAELIVVTGRSLPAPAGAAAYGSTLIERDRLTDEASGRLENALRDVAGFQQFRRSDSRAANPTSQGATLRALGGNASSRALVLLDGVPQLDPFAGWVAWPSLSPERLSSARVTRGGGAG